MKYAMMLVALALGGLVATSVPGVAADYESNCCGTCGSSNCNKVCRVVCEMKDVKEVRYKVVCEDFCVPGRSEKCGCKWLPGCGDVHTKRKLVKYEVSCKKPHWKYVVENLCPSCTPEDAVPAGAPLPPLPAAPKTAEAVSYEAEQPAEPRGFPWLPANLPKR
jgi:hypothetical protein